MNRPTRRRRWSRAWAACCAGWALWGTVVAAEPPLRVCADPDNLPFSKADGPEHGLYVDLAERVAQRLQRPIEWVWHDSSYQRRALRNTIQANQCDAYFALPADAEYRARGLQKSTGFLHVGYALVAPAPIVFSRLEDLKGRRVAVQYSSTPAVLLAGIDGVTVVTQRTAAAALDSLANGDADVAFVWGPSAGYEIARRFTGRWQVMSVTGHGLGGPVSVAVRRDQPELAKSIDQALDALRGDIDALARQYGFPRDKPLALERQSAVPWPPRVASRREESAVTMVAVPMQGIAAVADTSSASGDRTTRKSAPKPATKSVAKAAEASPAVAAAAPAEADPMAVAGRQKFNDICSHCHSPDGASPMRERDLRRLKMRYDDKWPDVASKTIHEGRPQLGMPTWKGQLADQDIERILAFLKTIQK